MPFVEYRRIPTQWEFFLCNNKRHPTHHHHSSTNPSSQPIIQPIINTSSKTYLFLVSSFFKGKTHFFFPSKNNPKLLRKKRRSGRLMPDHILEARGGKMATRINGGFPSGWLDATDPTYFLGTRKLLFKENMF